MPVAIVTGSGGLIGSESVAHFVEAGFDVVGLENDMRVVLLRPGRIHGAQTDRLLSALRPVSSGRSPWTSATSTP